MCVCVCMFMCSSLSCVRLFATPWTVAHQASLLMEFSRQEYWAGKTICENTRPPDIPLEKPVCRSGSNS